MRAKIMQYACLQSFYNSDFDSNVANNAIRYDSPRLGASLANRVEARGLNIRQAVVVLKNGMESDVLQNVFFDTFSCSRRMHINIPDYNILRLHAAWNLIALWLTASISSNNSNYTLREAELWFHGKNDIKTPKLTSLVTPASLIEADNILNNLVIDTELEQLLPYILETNGPGSRASVLKDPSTALSRATKRNVGIFYSPADVADYMNEQIYQLYDGNIFTAKALDPACGTGVFLLSLVRMVKYYANPDFSIYDYITSNIYGFDINRQALDVAAFLLLIECYKDTNSNIIVPQDAWKNIRNNLIEINALTVVSPQDNRGEKLDCVVSKDLTMLKTICPDVEKGFDILIGNPPYTKLGANIDFIDFLNTYDTLKYSKINSNIAVYLLFIEMMWRITKPCTCASALVLPLSISYHTGAQFQACRNAMSINGGQLKFAFFDREPHALFGEEVKTRNAIVFRVKNSTLPKRGHKAEISTTTLLRWSSRNRAKMFSNINFTCLDDANIKDGIPKLGSKLQADCFATLKNFEHPLSTFSTNIFKCVPANVLSNSDLLKVIIGGTAYNFLNVYHPINLQPERYNVKLSKSPVHCLQFESINDSHVAFAILNSRLVYWIWYILGDGFHITSRLFANIPFNKSLVPKDDYIELSHIGRVLWEKVREKPFISTNKGRINVGFNPLEHHSERDAIDNILVKFYNLNQDFAIELKQFARSKSINL